ncbi:MAG: metal-dependent hydrolase [Bdellovibrionota bacterium]
MPTIITHGIVAFAMAGKARGIRELHRWRVLVVCALCAMLPDIDYFGFKMSVQYSSMFGHRGFTHSIFFAALMALGASWLLHRRPQENFSRFCQLFLLLFAVTVSHPLLDAMTDGGEGVALFSPFSNHRYFFPYRPIMVSPLGIESFFRGGRGLLVLLDEFLLVVCPVAIVLYFPEIRKMAVAKKLAALALIGLWAAALAALQGLYPLNNVSMTINNTGRPVVDLFVKQYRNPRVLEFIPTQGLPEGKLVTKFGEFQRRGLFNRKLETSNQAEHWASGFFSNWFGGIAGRWQDPHYQLLLRTLLGYGVPDGREIREVLKESADNPGKRDFLFRLSPTEKYDLSLGDYGFSATKAILGTSHNASELPKFWYGICNGMAAASKWYAEPYRTVDVINPNGFRLRFHPNDVKALLGFAMAEISTWTELGTRCNINGPEADACRLNPGAFFLATMNRIGIARDAFIADGFSGTRKQFYLFDSARVEVLKGPTPVAGMKEWPVPTAVKYLAQVRFTMDFVSTLLSDKAGGAPDEAGREGYNKKVGRVVVPRELDAMIALGQDGEVIGGGWLGDEDVPDVVFFPGANPAVDEQNRLRANPALNWTVIRQIYEQSISSERDRAPVDFSL